MKIGVASFSMALNPISGGVMRCGVAPLISEVLMKLSFELRSEINSGRECSGFSADKNGTEEVGVFTDIADWNND